MLHINRDHTGKMEGMASLSTSALDNKACAARRMGAVGDNICRHCYSCRMLCRFSFLRASLKANGEILSCRKLRGGEIPFINAAWFRFEAFGELINKIHMSNYLAIALANPQCIFSLWTKSYNLARAAIVESHGKPANFILIVSSLGMNRPLNIERFPYADKVFTVYDRAYVESHGIEINCGRRRCIECRRCYTVGDEVKYINELVK